MYSPILYFINYISRRSRGSPRPPPRQRDDRTAPLSDSVISANETLDTRDSSYAYFTPSRRARPTVRPVGASWAPWLGQLRPIRAYSPSLHTSLAFSPLINTPNVR